MFIVFSVAFHLRQQQALYFQPVFDERGERSVHSRLAGRVGGLVGWGVAGLSAPPGLRWHTPPSGRHRRTRRRSRYAIHGFKIRRQRNLLGTLRIFQYLKTNAPYSVADP
jgi:hypothetical protein